jgi:Ca-activated chloride channel family protein
VHLPTRLGWNITPWLTPRRAGIAAAVILLALGGAGMLFQSLGATRDATTWSASSSRYLTSGPADMSGQKAMSATRGSELAALSPQGPLDLGNLGDVAANAADPGTAPASASARHALLGAELRAPSFEPAPTSVAQSLARLDDSDSLTVPGASGGNSLTLNNDQNANNVSIGNGAYALAVPNGRGGPNTVGGEWRNNSNAGRPLTTVGGANTYTDGTTVIGGNLALNNAPSTSALGSSASVGAGNLTVINGAAVAIPAQSPGSSADLYAMGSHGSVGVNTLPPTIVATSGVPIGGRGDEEMRLASRDAGVAGDADGQPSNAAPAQPAEALAAGVTGSPQMQLSAGPAPGETSVPHAVARRQADKQLRADTPDLAANIPANDAAPQPVRAMREAVAPDHFLPPNAVGRFQATKDLGRAGNRSQATAERAPDADAPAAAELAGPIAQAGTAAVAEGAKQPQDLQKALQQQSGQAIVQAQKAGEQPQGDVQRLLHRANELRKEQKYDRALEYLNQALFIDSNNEAAQAMKEIVEDTQLQATYTDRLRERNKAMAGQWSDNGEAENFYRELETYPSDWPALTRKRAAQVGQDAAAAAGEAPARAFEVQDLAEVKPATEVPQFDLSAALGSPHPATQPSAGFSFQSQAAAQQQQAAEAQSEQLMPASVFKAGPVNPWVLTEQDKFSTFALGVDTASYAIARNYLRRGYLPPPNSVRIEEFINSFDYNYPRQAENTFNIYAQAAPSPFAPAQQNLVLLKVGVQGRVIGREGRKAANLVLAVDSSGSMAQSDRMPLVQYALSQMVAQLEPQDRVTLISFATHAQIVLPPTSATQREKILAAIGVLQCGGSTNLVESLKLAYDMARQSFAAGQTNRVILCSDGMANIGATDAQELLGAVGRFQRQGVSFTSVGFGMGCYNDEVLQKLADKGDGSYVFVDSTAQARRVFVDGLAATLQTIARDAKIQVEFNAATVRRYRLIGYEQRVMAAEDFRNDQVKGGAVGSGQSGTALYELELTADAYPRLAGATLGTVYVRYRAVDDGAVAEIAQPIGGSVIASRQVADDPRFFLAAAAGEFAEILRRSEYVQGHSLQPVSRMLGEVAAQLPLDAGVRELAELVKRADGLPAAP